jgi:hypothetical protein
MCPTQARKRTIDGFTNYMYLRGLYLYISICYPDKEINIRMDIFLTGTNGSIPVGCPLGLEAGTHARPQNPVERGMFLTRRWNLEVLVYGMKFVRTFLKRRCLNKIIGFTITMADLRSLDRAW